MEQERRRVEPFQFEPVFPAGEEAQIPEIIEEEDIPRRTGNNDWCTCSCCTSMPSDEECFCCQELDVLNEKFDVSGVDCITEHPKFALVCLDEDVLKTALVALHDVRCNPIPDPITNRSWRVAAYRQFTWWAHGKLGKKRRRVIPSCVVKTIRARFPEESGIYVGFKHALIDLDQ